MNKSDAKVSSILLLALALVGCDLLQRLSEPPSWPYNKIPIEPGASIPDTVVGHAGKQERDKYRCTGGAIMVCESWGVSMSCRCTL